MGSCQTSVRTPSSIASDPAAISPTASARIPRPLLAGGCCAGRLLLAGRLSARLARRPSSLLAGGRSSLVAGGGGTLGAPPPARPARGGPRPGAPPLSPRA